MGCSELVATCTWIRGTRTQPTPDKQYRDDYTCIAGATGGIMEQWVHDYTYRKGDGTMGQCLGPLHDVHDSAIGEALGSCKLMYKYRNGWGI